MYVPNHRKNLGRVLVIYWLLLFAGTHLPLKLESEAPAGSDKAVHLIAYAGLAFLWAFRVSASRHFRWKDAGLIFLALAVFAAADELLQIPVGRHADVRDWVADCGGAVLGLLIFQGFYHVFPGWWELSIPLDPDP